MTRDLLDEVFHAAYMTQQHLGLLRGTIEIPGYIHEPVLCMVGLLDWQCELRALIQEIKHGQRSGNDTSDG